MMYDASNINIDTIRLTPQYWISKVNTNTLIDGPFTNLTFTQEKSLKLYIEYNNRLKRITCMEDLNKWADEQSISPCLYSRLLSTRFKLNCDEVIRNNNESINIRFSIM